MNSKLLYVSFDVVPSPKGASVHIEQFARILSNRYGALHLVTVAESNQVNVKTSNNELGQGIVHTTLAAPGDNLIDRVLNFRRLLEKFLEAQTFDLAHFRSPFEGYCLAKHKGRNLKQLVFEVNGLPSIELKYRYPQLVDDDVLIGKLLGQEQFCFEKSDLVITPSEITANLLKKRGVATEKLRVIPNGVDLSLFSTAPMPALRPDDKLRLLYFGTLSPWQGVDQALLAVSRLSKICKINLSIIASARKQQLDDLHSSIAQLSLSENVTVLPTCSQSEVLAHIHDSHIVLAPLSADDRNLEQGCCPFKILESMAAGRPVLASALPVVLEIAGSEPLVFLCKAGSAGSLQDALLELRSNPERLQTVAQLARRRIEENYSLSYTGKLLLDSYEELLKSSPINLSS